MAEAGRFLDFPAEIFQQKSRKRCTSRNSFALDVHAYIRIHWHILLYYATHSMYIYIYIITYRHYVQIIYILYIYILYIMYIDRDRQIDRHLPIKKKHTWIMNLWGSPQHRSSCPRPQSCGQVSSGDGRHFMTFLWFLCCVDVVPPVNYKLDYVGLAIFDRSRYLPTLSSHFWSFEIATYQRRPSEIFRVQLSKNYVGQHLKVYAFHAF